MAEIRSKCYLVLYISYAMSYKGKHKKNSQSISFISKTNYLHLKTSYMDESACLWKQREWNKFPFFGDKLSGKNWSRGLPSSDRVSEKSNLRCTNCRDRATGCVEKLHWTDYWEKQISVKTRTESLNKETHPTYGSRCSFDQKRKGIQKKKVWIGQNHILAAACYSENYFFKNRFQQ